jgi:hypothetical protein
MLPTVLYQDMICNFMIDLCRFIDLNSVSFFYVMSIHYVNESNTFTSVVISYVKVALKLRFMRIFSYVP